MTKKFDDKFALDDVSMEIEDGEFVVILGPSGCGKTTLLRCIAGLEEPDGGSISIDGKVVDDIPPRARDLSMVFQSYALFPNMSVRDNIAFPLAVRGTAKSDINKKVEEVTSFLGIHALLGKKPNQVSGGEQQRVAIARAIVREPKGFLLDEPLTGLDAPLRAVMRTEIKRIQRKYKITTLYVTHDQTEALSLGTRIGVMNMGRLLQLDRPKMVYSKPSSSFVAGFVGSPPANLVHVKITEENGKSFLAAGDFKMPMTEGLKGILTSGKSGGDFVLAIRPEDIKVSATTLPSPAMEALVVSSELLGNSTVLELSIGEVVLKATVPAGLEAKLDSNVWTSFDPSAAHVFDGATDSLVN